MLFSPPAWRRQLEGRAERIEEALPKYRRFLKGLQEAAFNRDASLRPLAGVLAAADEDVAEAIEALHVAVERGRVPSQAPVVRKARELAHVRQALASHLNHCSLTCEELAPVLGRLAVAPVSRSFASDAGIPRAWLGVFAALVAVCVAWGAWDQFLCSSEARARGQSLVTGFRPNPSKRATRPPGVPEWQREEVQKAPTASSPLPGRSIPGMPEAGAFEGR